MKRVSQTKEARKVAAVVEAIEEATRTTSQNKTISFALKQETKGIENAFKLYSDMLGNDAKETWDQVTAIICHTEQDGPNRKKLTPGMTVATLREFIHEHTLR